MYPLESPNTFGFISKTSEA